MMTIPIRRAAGVAGAVLVVLSGVSIALAQNYNASEAVSVSSLGTMQCGEFTRLSPRARDNVVRRMVADAPQRSLTSPAGPTFDSDTGRIFRIPNSDSATSGTPLSAGQLIAACQAASPGSTLRGAFAQFNSGSNMLVRPR
jgi:hypothetical protein